MLIDFYVENFLSFKDGVNFTMLADTQSKQERPDAVIKVGKYELLRSAGLWGPNAGGKSNFLKALSVMSLMVHGVHINSLKNSILPVTKFKLNESCDEKPTTFEVRFLLQSVLWQGSSIDMVFRYGIQYTAERIHAEWLYGNFSPKESKLFVRNGSEIEVGDKFAEGAQVMKSLGSISEAALFMPLIETLKGENAPINHAVRSWFGKFVDISAVVEGNLSSTPAILLRDPIWSKIILNAFKAADINVERFVLKELSSENETEEVPPISGEKAGAPVSLFTEHKRYNENHKEVGRILFSLDNEESAGSRQFFRMISHFFIVLHNGLLITVDELDAKLHPQLCEMLLNLFNSPTTNPNNAQLIFATHNPLLMDRKLLRRDQIWFVEKNSFGESDLYCLTDFKKVRNDASYAKNYLMGRYGALPYLGDFENLMPEAEK